MRQISNSKRAFSMTELMVTLLIVGILAGVAIPLYNSYSRKIQMAEAFTFLDVVTKSEISYFLDHNKFFCSFNAPQSTGTGDSQANFTPSGGRKIPINSTIATGTSWENLGKPIADGTDLNFKYMGFAGKTNSTGAALPSQGVNNQYSDIPASLGNQVRDAADSAKYMCQSPDLRTNFPPYGTTTPDKVWVLVGAIGNLINAADDIDPQHSNMSLCTFMFRLIATNDTGKVGTGPIVQYNAGH